MFCTRSSKPSRPNKTHTMRWNTFCVGSELLHLRHFVGLLSRTPSKLWSNLDCWCAQKKNGIQFLVYTQDPELLPTVVIQSLVALPLCRFSSFRINWKRFVIHEISVITWMLPGRGWRRRQQQQQRKKTARLFQMFNLSDGVLATLVTDSIRQSC